MTHTCDERCVGKQEGGRVEVGIESPVVHGKQPVRPLPAARGELEKDVPYAVSHRVARKEKMALKASVPVRVESMSVHGTTASVNPAARTCTGLFERSEFLFATCKKKKTDGLCVCSANLGFSVRSANRIRPKHGIPLSKYIVF